MYHLDNTSGVPEMPEPKEEQSISPRWFGESQEQGGISWPGADWFNMIQAELLNLLEAAGIQPEKKSHQQISDAIPVLGDRVIRADMDSAEPGKGADLSAFQRRFVLSRIVSVATALNAGKVSLWEYEEFTTRKTISGVEVVNWTEAVRRALIDCATYRRQLLVPGGEYYIEKLPEFTNLSASSSLSSMSMYSIVGDGHDQTIFWTDGTSGRELHFSTCRFCFQDFSMERRGVSVNDFNIPLMQLGRSDTISAARLGYMKNVRFNGSGWGLNIEHGWDNIYDNVIVHNFGTVAIRLGIHSLDNTNNQLFIRPHVESCRYTGTELCRAFVNMSEAGGSRRNHGITLIQPHIEPGNYRCSHLHLAYPQNFTVINPQFNRNDTKQVASIPASQAAPIIYSSDGVGLSVMGGQIQHIGERAADVAPVMRFVGIHKGFRCDSYIETGNTNRTSLKAGLNLASSINGMRELDFKGVKLNSFTEMSSVGDRLRVGPMENLQQVFDLIGESYIPPGSTNTISKIVVLYSNTQDQSTPQKSVIEITSEGHIRARAFLGDKVSIAAGASVTVNIGEGTVERRGKYGIYGCENDSGLNAEFFNAPSQEPDIYHIGARMSVTRSQPTASVTGKLCAYQSGQYITLENRLATAVSVSVHFYSS
ncbi:phage tail protein [Klebsiella pneumoniae]|uniref:phage tail protein n=1 Tax=Klebsiella pneumoniae TaxID=573 RepID=UPI00396A8755